MMLVPTVFRLTLMTLVTGLDFYDMERYRSVQTETYSPWIDNRRGSSGAVKFVRENRAIETTLKNVVERGEPITGDLDNANNRFPGWQNIENTGSYDFDDDLTENPQEPDPAKLLEELRQGAQIDGTNDENDGIRTSHRQARRRKLTSQEQGVLLVEALRKRRNYTSGDDPRGQETSVQSSIMDMLGRSRRISDCLV